MRWHSYGGKDYSKVEQTRQLKTKDNPNQPNPIHDIPGITSGVLRIFFCLDLRASELFF